ncbi:T6SS immunity protein Tdi1 domain-containing protein [Myceligenerans crystallogenes]|uniref:T6SS immunity protein Tdi1 C-terminal domain-containing protein n=1 Tax=Myceligenerans crystallogenes TaxID=316335 RepID=A0ABP4ZL96_9MICO
MQLIREFTPAAFDFAMASWSWLGITDHVPRFATCFGDMFLESPAGWWFLDTVEGSLELRWRTMNEMFADLKTADGRAEYLLEDTLGQAAERGMSLAGDEVFAFIPAPAITGTMDPDNLTPLRFAIAASLAGRIHQELRLAARALPAAPTPVPPPVAAPPSAGGYPAPAHVPAHQVSTYRPPAPVPAGQVPGHHAPPLPAEPEPVSPRRYASGPTPAVPAAAVPAAAAARPARRYDNPAPYDTPPPLPAWAPPSHVPPETTLTGSYPATRNPAPPEPGPAPARRARHFA